MVELTIRSTTKPQAGRPTVKNRVAKPKIGARELVRTPSFGSVRLEVAPPSDTTDS